MAILKELGTRGDAGEPWGYVASVVAAVVTHATSVRHIYLIISQPLSHDVFCPLPPLITYIVVVNCFTIPAIPSMVQLCSTLFIALFTNGDIHWRGMEN